jgi:hypothetical protein
LILHPFADPAGPDLLVESSRAHLMLQGLLPAGGLSQGDMEARLLNGRFCELRMLFYVGKDLDRWISQCLELVERDELLSAAGITAASFAALLTEDPPVAVREKLSRWGVADYRAIFSRAFGIRAIFAAPPERNTLALSFVRQYYRFADHMFSCRQSSEPFTAISQANFPFELFASGEYTRMLEREWEGA